MKPCFARMGGIAYASILLVLLASPAIRAQKDAGTSRQFARSSPRGIYVFCGSVIASPDHPVGDTIGYRVERRSGREAWKAIADVAAVATWNEFRVRVGDTLLARVARALRLASPAQLWDTVLATPSLGAVPYFSGLPAMRALGMLYLDSLAVRGVAYEYRVSRLLRSGAAVRPQQSASVVCGQPWNIGVMSVAAVEETDSAVTVEWITPAVKPEPQAFRVYRRMSGQEEFRLLPHVAGLTGRRDTMVCRMYDRHLRRNQQYEYYVVPVDIVENLGPESQTATVFTINPTRLPLPQQLRATGDTTSIRLAWRSAGRDLVLATRIYRSMHRDSGYVNIAEVSSSDTTYTDESARGMIRYFYRLSNVTYDNRESQKSAVVFGWRSSELQPATPQQVRATPVGRGVEIAWAAGAGRDSAGQDIAGYSVSRACSSADSFRVVSPLVQGGRWVDTSAGLLGTVEYRYTVTALSTSRARSIPSLEVRARPLIATSPKPPREISARERGEGIALSWNDPRDDDPTVSGYMVYRGAWKEHSVVLKPLARLPDAPAHTSWFDSTAVAGERYVYAVASVDMFGGEGIRSRGVEAMIRIVLPPPPPGLHASANAGAVLLEWDGMSDTSAAKVAIYRNERGTNPRAIAVVAATARRYVDRNVRKGVVYYYSVASADARKREGRRSPAVYAVP